MKKKTQNGRMKEKKGKKRRKQVGKSLGRRKGGRKKDRRREGQIKYRFIPTKRNVKVRENDRKKQNEKCTFEAQDIEFYWLLMSSKSSMEKDKFNS